MPTFTHDYAFFLSTIGARTAVIAVFLAIGLKLLGKREIGQMNLCDLALIMLLANAVQNAMTNGAGDLSVGIVSAGSLFIVGAVVTFLFRRLPKLEERSLGSPTSLLSDGQWIPGHLRRERVTQEEVLAAMRQHGITDPSQIQLAILEVDGTISIVPKKAGAAENSASRTDEPSSSPGASSPSSG